MTEEKQNNVCVLPVYRKDQWQALLGDGAKELEDTWEEWNAFSGEMIAGLEGRGIPYVRIPPDLEEIKQFCEEEGIPNDGEARYRLLYQRFNAEISNQKSFPITEAAASKENAISLPSGFTRKILTVSTISNLGVILLRRPSR
jgi:hypothetical protein